MQDNSKISEHLTDMDTGINSSIISDTNFADAPPSDEKPPRSKKAGIKLVTGLLGMILLIGGMAAGVVLVLQPQLFSKMAQVTYTSATCTVTNAVRCERLANGSFTGNAQVCRNNVWTNNRCPYGCSNGKCLPQPDPGPCVGTGTTKCETGFNNQFTGVILGCGGGRWHSGTCPSSSTCGYIGTTAQCIAPTGLSGTGLSGVPSNSNCRTRYGCPGIIYGGFCQDLVDSCTVGSCFNGQCAPGKVCDPVINRCITAPFGLTDNGQIVNGHECFRSGNTYCDGRRIYEMYLWYSHQNGWWGTLTPVRFLGMMLQAESTGSDVQFLNSVMTVTQNQMWGDNSEHDPYCQSASCVEGIFNFLGAYSQSTINRYNVLYRSGFQPLGNDLQGLMGGSSVNDIFSRNGLNITTIGNRVLGASSTAAFTNDTPTHVGINLECGEQCGLIEFDWVNTALNTRGVQQNTTDRCGIYDVSPGGAVAYTLNQKYNWSLPQEQSPCY